MQSSDHPPPGQPAASGFGYPGYGPQPMPDQPAPQPYWGAAPPYGAYAYGQPIAAPKTSGFAIASLVTSLISWFIIPLIGGIVAVVLGHIARGEIRRSNGAITGGGMALAGLIIGYIQIALMLIAIVIVVWIALIFASHPNTTF